MSGLIEVSVVNKSGILNLSFLSLWKNQVPIREWQWVFLSNGFYTFSSICILSYMCKKHSSYKTLTKFADSKFIFLELVTVLTLISICLTALFGGALSFASTYYLDSIKLHRFSQVKLVNKIDFLPMHCLPHCYWIGFIP